MIFDFDLHNQENDLRNLGIALETGVSLLDAVQTITISGHSYKLKKAFLFAFDRLLSGSTPAEAFSSSDCIAIPHWTRIILGSTIHDREKGQIILAHLDSFKPGEFGSYANYILTHIGIICVVCLSQLRFVIPQFKAIFYGLQIELPWLTQIIFFMEDIFVLLLILSFLILLIMNTIVYKITPSSKKCELLFLVRIFNILSKNRLAKVLAAINSPILFPNYHSVCTSILSRINNASKPLAETISSGLTTIEQCFFNCAYFAKEKEDIYPCFIDMLEASFRKKENQFRVFFSIVATIGIAVFTGSMTIAIFLPLMRIVEALL